MVYAMDNNNPIEARHGFSGVICFNGTDMNRPYKRREIKDIDKWEVITRDRLVCVQCKETLHLKEVKRPVVIDGAFHHIIPMVYGGSVNYHNVCLLCRTCHNKVHSGNEDKKKYFEMFESFIRAGKLF